jgi:hypothetical protein
LLDKAKDGGQPVGAHAQLTGDRGEGRVPWAYAAPSQPLDLVNRALGRTAADTELSGECVHWLRLRLRLPLRVRRLGDSVSEHGVYDSLRDRMRHPGRRGESRDATGGVAAGLLRRPQAGL